MVDRYGKFIVAFDVKTENLRIIRLPNALTHAFDFYPSLEVKGNLAILDS